MSQLAFDFEAAPGELPRNLLEWFWRCQKCAKHPPVNRDRKRLRPPSCPKCGAEMEKVAFDPHCYEVYMPLDRAIRQYEERLAEDRRRVQLVIEHDPDFARKIGWIE